MKVKVIFDLPEISNKHTAEEIIDEILTDALDETTTERLRWRLAKPRQWNHVEPIEDK